MASRNALRPMYKLPSASIMPNHGHDGIIRDDFGRSPLAVLGAATII